MRPESIFFTKPSSSSARLNLAVPQINKDKENPPTKSHDPLSDDYNSRNSDNYPTPVVRLPTSNKVDVASSIRQTTYLSRYSYRIHNHNNMSYQSNHHCSGYHLIHTKPHYRFNHSTEIGNHLNKTSHHYYS